MYVYIVKTESTQVGVYSNLRKAQAIAVEWAGDFPKWEKARYYETYAGESNFVTVEKVEVQ